MLNSLIVLGTLQHGYMREPPKEVGAIIVPFVCIGNWSSEDF